MLTLHAAIATADVGRLWWNWTLVTWGGLNIIGKSGGRWEKWMGQKLWNKHTLWRKWLHKHSIQYGVDQYPKMHYQSSVRRHIISMDKNGSLIYSASSGLTEGKCYQPTQLQRRRMMQLQIQVILVNKWNNRQRLINQRAPFVLLDPLVHQSVPHHSQISRPIRQLCDDHIISLGYALCIV